MIALSRLLSSRSGASALEYGMMLALLALLLIGPLNAMGGKLSETFDEIGRFGAPPP